MISLGERSFTMFEILMLATFFVISLSQLLAKPDGKCPPCRSRLNRTQNISGKSLPATRHAGSRPRNHRSRSDQTGRL